MYTRMTDKRLQKEGFSRLKLQKIGVEILLDNPEGLLLSGGKWEDISLSYSKDLFKTSGRVIGVHNGYLGRCVKYGWVMFFFVICNLFFLITIIKGLMSTSERNGTKKNTQIALGTTLSASLVQALMHNASFVTHDPATLSLIAIGMAEYSNLRRKNE